MDRLLIAARDLTIETNSEKILQDRLTGSSVPPTFDSLNKTDASLVIVIDDLRAHTKLLGRYFTTFHQLATSDSPEEVSGSLQSTANKLNGLSTQLRQQTILTDQNVAAVGALAQMAVQQQIRASLRHELKTNQMTIRTALSTQQRLLDLLTQRIKDDMQDLRDRRQQRLLSEPLAEGAIASRANQDRWIGDRHALLTQGHGVVRDLQTASQSLGELQQVYEGLLVGDVDLERVNRILADFEDLLTAAEVVEAL